MLLSDICEIIMGQSPSSDSYNVKGQGLPFFQGNADFGKLYPSVRLWCNCPIKKAEAGDLLVSVRAPIGAVNLANQKCCIGRGLAALRPYRDKCDAMYLYYLIKAGKNKLNWLGTGSTFKAITRSSLLSFNVPDYCMALQRKISGKLWSVDKLIHQRNEQLKLFDLLIQSRFLEMFSTVQSRVLMKDICSIITDGTHQPPKFVTYGIPFIFVSNIVGNEITYNAEKFIDQKTYDELIKRTPIEIGDLILSTVGSYGHPAVVRSNRKFLFQRHIAYLKPRHELVNSDYLHSAILTEDVQRQINSQVNGIAQKTLNLSSIKQLQILVPPLEQQEQFVCFKRQVDKSKYGGTIFLRLLEDIRICCNI